MANQTLYSLLAQKSTIEIMIAEMCKPYEIYRKMSNVYGEACFSFKKW